MHNMPHNEAAKEKMRETHLGKPNFTRRRPMLIINGVEHFRCGKCHEFFPKEGFYKNKRTILGITSECRNCHCKTSLNSRDQELARKNNREYARRAVKANPKKFRELWKKRNIVKDERYTARMLLNRAVKRGDITKPNRCEECDQEIRLTAHHDDYSQPLKVRWLCYECHGKLHRKSS
jgi:hypothetical protein